MDYGSWVATNCIAQVIGFAVLLVLARIGLFLLDKLEKKRKS
jgi:hypothetical protein